MFWGWTQPFGGCKWKFGVLDLRTSKIGLFIAVSLRRWNAGAMYCGTYVAGVDTSTCLRAPIHQGPAPVATSWSDPRERMVCA